MSGERRFKIPPHLLHGRVRTTTAVMCTLWLGMWLLYLFLNQPDEQPGGPPPSTAVIISDTPYVPYTPPPVSPSVTEPTETWTTTAVPAPTTSPDTPESDPTESSTPTSTEEAPHNPFRFEIPGLPRPETTTTQPPSDETGE